MRLFRNERFLRIARPLLTTLAVAGAIWHATHALSAWSRMQEFRTSDPSRSDFHWDAVQMEIGVTLAAVVAAFLAWQVFDLRRSRPPQQ